MTRDTLLCLIGIAICVVGCKTTPRLDPAIAHIELWQEPLDSVPLETTPPTPPLPYQHEPYQGDKSNGLCTGLDYAWKLPTCKAGI